MEFERKRYRPPYLNMAPLVDVVFLLLLFFMLSSHLIQEPSIGLNLPPSGTAALDDSEDAPTVHIASTGDVFLGETPITLTGLRPALARLDPSRQKLIRLRADREVDVGLLVRVIDEVRQAGITRFSLVTAEESDRGR